MSTLVIHEQPSWLEGSFDVDVFVSCKMGWQGKLILCQELTDYVMIDVAKHWIICNIKTIPQGNLSIGL